MSAAGVVSEEMRRRLPSSEEDAAFLSLPGVGGGTLVADPHGNVVAGPLGDGEDILAVSADLGEVVSAKLVHDYAGHYNRPEVFTLLVRTDHPQLFRAVAEGAPSRADPAWPAPGQIAETRARPVPAAETDGRSAEAPEAVPVRVAAECGVTSRGSAPRPPGPRPAPAPVLGGRGSSPPGAPGRAP